MLEKMRMASIDVEQSNVQKIESLFPNCITESKDENGVLKKFINFDLLKSILQNEIVEGKNQYEFTWAGKNEAICEVNSLTTETLRPFVNNEESVNWNNTKNIYIEGDNLTVLKLLQESYLNKIKMIYIDPPYNTGSDSFLYSDNYKIDKGAYEELIGLHNENGNVLFKENNTSNAQFHSDWCSMIFERIKLAYNLLSDDGVILISMADTELSNLLKICEEIFNKNNIEIIVWKKKGGAGNTEKILGVLTEYIVCCFKNKTSKAVNYQTFAREYAFEDEIGKFNLEGIEKSNLGTYERPTMLFEICDPKTGEKFKPSFNMRWTIGKETVDKYIKQGKLYFDYKNHKVKRIKRPEDYEESQNVFYNLLLEEGSLSTAKDEIKTLLGNREIFDTPKPTSLINKLIEMFSNDDSIIMDFFAGSATTAHSVMLSNAKDGGNRSFILVQYPEECKEGSEAQKNGYKTICEIGKERIKKASKQIILEYGTTDVDMGFRVFKVASSNMKDVYYSANDYSQDLLSSLESNIKEDRTDLDLLFNCILEWGLPLSLSYTSEKINGCNVHTYNDGDLIACFDENINEETIKEIAKRQPLRVVFRDSSFYNSAEKINVEEIFKLLSPDTRIKVL